MNRIVRNWTSDADGFPRCDHRSVIFLFGLDTSSWKGTGGLDRYLPNKASPVTSCQQKVTDEEADPNLHNLISHVDEPRTCLIHPGFSEPFESGVLLFCIPFSLVTVGET